MIVHPSIEGRDLLADDAYPGYRALLQAERDKYEGELIRPPRDHRRMDWLAGAITALDFALRKPEQMKDSNPAESTT